MTSKETRPVMSQDQIGLSVAWRARLRAQPGSVEVGSEAYGSWTSGICGNYFLMLRSALCKAARECNLQAGLGMGGAVGYRVGFMRMTESSPFKNSIRHESERHFKNSLDLISP
jgi:hypothetical protein